MKWRWLGVLAALLPGVSDAQLDIVNGLTVEEYVNDILLGSGVQASNIVLSGSIEQLGYLTGGDGTFSVTSGLVMSTEVATNSDCQVEDFCINCVAPSPDPELLAIANSVPPLIGQTFTVNSLHDLVALEFDFTAMGDTVRFNYVFGSDEYLTFVNTQYNDAFGFFLSGPGITGPFSSPPGFPGGSVNIAFVPGSDPELPITISSVNNVTNSAYYINNPGGASGACLNGYTVPFTAEWPVECGETYHIRLVIADGSDTALESIVVLEEGSFQSNAVVDVDLVIDVGGVEGNVLHEGCGSATLTFTRPQETIIEVQEYVVISYDGSVGINGIDFSLLPDTVFFPPGVYTQEFNLQAFQDGLNEGAELVVMEILNVAACNGAGLTTFFEFNLADNPPPLVVEPAELLLCPGGSVTVEPVVSGGYGFYTYSWCDGSTGETLSVTPSASYTCELVVGDTCALPTAAADFDITILLPPAATAGADLIACGDATLGGTILGLPPATCSDDAGNYTYCYGENEVTSFTYCPDTPGDGTYMTVSFSGGFNENFFDEMYVYDGPDATAPLLAGPVYGALAGQTYIANNPGGCLTLQIASDGSVSCVSGALEPWEYAVGCTNAGGVTWSWSPATGLGSTTVPNPVVNVTESTTYTLTAGLASFPFCSTTDQVTVSPSFNFTHALTEPGCFMNDGAVTVEVVPNGTSGPWMVRAVLNGVVVASALNTGGSTTLGGLAPGTYVLEVEDDICLADEAFTLAVPPMLTITASADTTICIDGTAILTASAAFADPNLQWHWSTGSTSSSITVGPGSDETYGVYATWDDGCATATEAIAIDVLDPLELVPTIGGVICPEESLEIGVSTATGGLPPYSYAWTGPPSGGFQQGVADQTVSPDLTATYCITLIDACETPAVSACIEVLVPEDLTAEFALDTVQGCTPFGIELTGLEEDLARIATALWTFGDGGASSSVGTASHTYVSPGVWDLGLTLVSVEGCTYTYDMPAAVTTRIPPVAAFAASPWVTALPETRFEFTNYSQRAVAYAWDFGGQGTSNETDPVFTFPPATAGEYLIELVVVDEGGCRDSLVQAVMVQESCVLFIPTSFTPDMDGLNDAWFIQGIDVDASDFEVWVFNRWGDVVYNSRSMDEPWVGNVQGGSYFAPNDTYFYRIETVSLATRERKLVTGTVTLTR